MKHGLMDHLVCPQCGGGLRLTIGEQDAHEIITGTLNCQGCQHTYQITRGVPRFVAADAYSSTFSRQRMYVRRHFGSYLGDRSADKWFEPSTGLSAEDLRAGVSLEVGCGYGRYLEYVDRRGGEVIGIDLSTHSADLSYDFVGRRPGVHVVQCDLFAMPFRKRYFRNVFSIGVLHHTPDTRKAVDAIDDFVAPGGRLSVWLYHPADKRSADVWRKLMCRLPEQFVYALCVLNQATTSWLRGLPGGWRLGRIFPGAAPAKGFTFWRRVLGDFDNLTPKYAYSHRAEEVTTWFQELGLREITTLSRRTAVRGVKPA
jgi:SAM-dependent methyltransferase